MILVRIVTQKVSLWSGRSYTLSLILLNISTRVTSEDVTDLFICWRLQSQNGWFSCSYDFDLTLRNFPFLNHDWTSFLLLLTPDMFVSEDLIISLCWFCSLLNNRRCFQNFLFIFPFCYAVLFVRFVQSNWVPLIHMVQGIIVHTSDLMIPQ